MTKQDAVKKLTAFLKEQGVTLTKAQATLTIEYVHGLLDEGLKNDNEAVIYGLGRLKMVDQAARKARNPRTGEVIDVPARKVIRFKASAAKKDD